MTELLCTIQPRLAASGLNVLCTSNCIILVHSSHFNMNAEIQPVVYYRSSPEIHSFLLFQLTAASYQAVVFPGNSAENQFRNSGPRLEWKISSTIAGPRISRSIASVQRIKSFIFILHSGLRMRTSYQARDHLETSS